MPAPAGALAQDRTPTPSAHELWESYPLEDRPSEPSARAAATATPPERPPAQEEDGGMTPALLMGLLAAGLAGGASAAWLARRRRRDGADRAPAKPLLRLLSPVSSPALPHLAPASGDRPEPRRDRAAQPRKREPAGPARRLRPAPRDRAGAATPPDRAVAWTAEIHWRDADGAGRFRVVARSADGRAAVVGQSMSLDWPPAGAEAVQALTAAADRLEVALIDAGWTKLAPGTAWYARRFGWEPASPASEPPAAAPPRGSGRFRRQPGWPKGTEERWRCEITWHAGYITSYFEATVYAPGRHRGKGIGESERFKWLLLDDPSPAQSAHLREARRLAAALRAAGWQRLEDGAKWYAARYVWPGDGEPPERLEPAPATKGGST